MHGRLRRNPQENDGFLLSRPKCRAIARLRNYLISCLFLVRVRLWETSVMTPFKTAIPVPVLASHSRAVLSSDAVATRRPSGLNAALHTEPSWPIKTAISVPVSASHSRAVLSKDAVATR